MMFLSPKAVRYKNSDRSNQMALVLFKKTSRIPLPPGPLTKLKTKKWLSQNFIYYCTAFYLCLKKAAGFANCVFQYIGSLHVAKNTELDILMKQI